MRIVIVGMFCISSSSLRYGNQWGSNIFLGSNFTSVGPEPPGLPRETRLYQNYPNPFHPSTEIGFQITDHGLVKLNVYDVLGREVGTVVNEVKAPGTYTVQWNGSGVSSGVYFHRLQTGSFVQTKRLLLLK
jgi:hypothetical protein